MSLLNKIGESDLGLKGKTPPKRDGAKSTSTLHNQYSLNGNPNEKNKPAPSDLDLDGKTPPKYLDNPPK